MENLLVRLHSDGVIHAILHKEDQFVSEAFRAILNLFSCHPEHFSDLRAHAVQFLKERTRAALMKMDIDVIGHEELC